MQVTITALALLSLTTTSNATLVEKNFDADPLTVVFKDEATGLIWTNTKSFSPAASNFLSAKAAVAAATFENLSDWRLPTYTDFQSLYTSLGANGIGTMNLGPLTGPFGNDYWTADIRDSSSTFTWSPFGNTRTFAVNGADKYIWAVTAVPEPTSASLLVSGMLAMFSLLASVRQRCRQKGDA